MLHPVRHPLAALLVAAAVACSHPNVDTDPAARQARVQLRIDNQNFADADIYAVRLATRYRLGFAPSHQSVVLTVPVAALDNGDLQLDVHLIGGSDYRTELVHVDVDQQPLLELNENLALSVFSVVNR